MHEGGEEEGCEREWIYPDNVKLVKEKDLFNMKKKTWRKL